MTAALRSGKAAAASVPGAATRGPSGPSEAAPGGMSFQLALGACTTGADTAFADQPSTDDATPAADASALPADPAPPAPPLMDAAALLAQGGFTPQPATAGPSWSLRPPAAGESAALAGNAAAAPVAAVGTAAATGLTAPSPGTAPQGAGEAPANAAKGTTPFGGAPAQTLPWRGGAVAGELGTDASGAGAGQTPAPPQQTPHMPQQQWQHFLPPSQRAAAGAIADAPATAHTSAAMAAPTAEPAVQIALAPVAFALHRGERPDERAPGAHATPAGADAQAGFAPGGSSWMPGIDAASAGAAGAQGGLAERMVEQVSWWLSQRTQGAEMTLDVPGGAPVSVSIQVQGNEAQVAFRSDQVEARQLLANAMPQLKEMLGAEGLVLSGSSVGTSAGGAHDGEAAPEAPARRRGMHAEALPVAAGPVRRPVPGRALDLYV